MARSGSPSFTVQQARPGMGDAAPWALGEKMRLNAQARVRTLKTGVALAALMGAALAAVPGFAAAQTADDQVEAVVVTGSRIQRKDISSVGPLSTLTAEDIKFSGAASIGDLLQRLPSAGVSLNTNGTQGTAYGAASLNLRYLGSAEGSGNRTLVLVDGHRFVDGVGQRGFRDFVDLNSLPFGIIESVEVLKDGASAVYGADAIAGVVNIHTVQKLDGVALQAKYGTTTHGDGRQWSFVANIGKQFSRGSVFFSASYIKDGEILSSDRKLTTMTLVPQTVPPTSDRGLYILPGLAGNAYFGAPAGFASVATPATLVPGTTAFGVGALADNSFRGATLPADAFNTFAQGLYTVGPSERYGIFGRATADLTNHVHWRVEGLYNRRKSNQLFSPLQLSIGGNRGTARGVSIAAAQAFNPFGTANGVPAANALAFGATQAWEVRINTSAVGNRDNIQDVQTWRVATGLEGDFDMLGSNWKWDLFGTIAQNEMESKNLNQINYDRLALSLGNPALCAQSGGCVPVNVFGLMTAAQGDYIRFDAAEANITRLTDVAFNITGDLFRLPAGPVGFAAGLEHRKNEAQDFPDPYANATAQFLAAGTQTTSSQTRTATVGSYSLNEVYGELSVPLLKDMALVRNLDLSLAGRYSKYNLFKGKSTFKVGASYRPVDGLMFRGTYSQGFRAPSILELYQGARQTSFQGTDPCNGGQAANASKPGCVGVPANYNQLNFNGNGLIPGTTSGTTTLKPETANTYSFGVALQPAFLRGFSLTVDYYDIKVKDAISSQAPVQILTLCAFSAGAFCDLVRRDRNTGEVLNLIQASQNLNRVETAGIDTTVRYDFRTSIGRFSAVIDTSYLSKFRTIAPNPNGGAVIVDDRAGKGDQPRATYPRWKGQGSLRWSPEWFDLTYRARYIGSSTDVVNPVKDARTKAIIYHDLEGTYRLPSLKSDISIGVSNIFDKMPPASYANAPINFDIYTYDVRGRYVYARVSSRF